MSAPRFAGFSRETFRFFQDLTGNNNRKWFDSQRERYQEHVLEPAQAFVNTLGPKLAARQDGLCYDARANGAGSIFRIHRDTRFSKDKSPYKTNLGILFWFEGPGNKKENPGYYFHLDGTGAWLYAGLHGFPRERLNRYREAVGEEQIGSGLRRILKRLSKAGLETGGCHYKRVPSGFAADHPHQDLLRYNALWARSAKMPRKVVNSGSALVTESGKFCRTTQPLNGWLLEHT